MAVIFQDAFTNASDDVALPTHNAAWGTTPSLSNLETQGNTAGQNANGFYGNLDDTNTYADDQYSQAVFVNVMSAAGEWQAATCREQTGALDHYGAGLCPYAFNTADRVWRNAAFTFTSIATQAASILAGDTVQCRAVGSTISLYINGSLAVENTNTGIAAGRGGISARRNSTTTQSFDDYESGDFAAAGWGALLSTHRNRLVAA